MKVGRITLLTAFLLALPLAAFAGNDPCPGDTDLDADTICDLVDNCPPSVNWPTGIANPTQIDTDGDGRGDLCDNCRTRANGPLTYDPVYHPAITGPCSQYDGDSDGMGNACDATVNNDKIHTAADTPVFLTILGGGFMATPPATANFDCNKIHTAADTPLFLTVLGGGFMAGPGGLACSAQVPGAHPLGIGACPPLK